MKFHFDERIKSNYYTALYFEKTSKIISKYKKNQTCVMQFFQRQDNVYLCGIEEVLELLKFAIPAAKYKTLKIQAIPDGKLIDSNESVLKIEGNYAYFGFLEGIIDGILSKRTSFYTKSKLLQEECKGYAEIIFMGERSDDYQTQMGDGYAAYVSGIRNLVTQAQCEYGKLKPIGTMPHALIQQFEGDIVEALKYYEKTFPNDKLIALTDFNNDVIKDSLKCLKTFGLKLYGVRVDTSKSNVDEFFKGKEKEYEGKDIFGINPYLIKELRKELDKNGGSHVKIIISSGVNPKTVQWFKKENARIDYVGVGQYLKEEDIFFTGDLVKLNNKPLAKVGRQEFFSKKLKKIK